MPALAYADWVYVGQTCTPQYIWVEPVCPTPVVITTTSYCYRPIQCPTPTKNEDACLKKKLQCIREEALEVLEGTKASLEDHGWKVVKAERDRWKTQRYILKISARSTDGSEKATFYQVVTGTCDNFEVIYVWSYDRNSTDYCPDDIIGDICDLIAVLTN